MPRNTDRISDAPVWDIWVRLFHWLLVAAIAVAAGTGFLADATWLRLHVAGGLAAAALVLARIVWGFLGSPHARFSDFVPAPRAVLDHLAGRGTRHLGHNPLGALMVLALIAVVLALALTGVAVLGGALRSGPVAANLDVATGLAALEVHESVAFVLLGLVALHLAGVAFESRRARENLARAMITGRKAQRPGDVPTRPARAHGVVALAVIVLIGGGLAAANAALSDRPLPSQPAAALDPVVADECGACHMVYHPALLPAATWGAITATLDDHYGEDASLAAATTAEISAWLEANASDRVETRAARAFTSAPPEPVAITDLPAWQLLHSGVPGAVFSQRSVASRSNCAACHRDAETGRFSPFAIVNPKETNP